MRILVVDDVVENLDAAAKAFEGYEVVWAKCLSQALELLEEQKFDRCVTDLFFPELHVESNGPCARTLIDFLVAKGWRRGSETMAPLGMHVYGTAVAKGVPTVFLTDGNRHDGVLGVLLTLRCILNDLGSRYWLMQQIYFCTPSGVEEKSKTPMAYSKVMEYLDKCLGEDDFALQVEGVNNEPDETRKLIFGF